MPKFKDWTGETVNGYSVLGFARYSNDDRPRPEWTFQCQCGNTFIAQASSVKNGLRTCKACKSAARLLDVSGQVFGLLKAERRVGVDHINRSLWEASCTKCGVRFVRSIGKLTKAKSCPCRSHLVSHGHSGSRTYKTWNAMMMRCFNPNTHRYDRYGGRGITACDRWKTFENFLADMGERPEHASLDRIDNDGNYEPGNCRWATRNDQRRNMEQNTLITYNGQTRTLAEWAERIGIAHHTLRWRYVRQGWSAERSLTEPIIRGAKHNRVQFNP